MEYIHQWLISKLISRMGRMSVNHNYTSSIALRMPPVVQFIDLISRLPQTVEQNLDLYWRTKRDQLSQLCHNLFPNLPLFQPMDADVQQEMGHSLYKDLELDISKLRGYVRYSLLAPIGVHKQVPYMLVKRPLS